MDHARCVHPHRCGSAPKRRGFLETPRRAALRAEAIGVCDPAIPGWPQPHLFHQRFTRPTRDMVILAVCVPRRNTTVVLEAPKPIPVAPKITVSLESSRETPWPSGPGQRSIGNHLRSPHSSIPSESGAMESRARVVRSTAALRVTANAVVSSDAARSTAIRSSSVPQRGSANAVTRPITAKTTASSERE